ncbi:MAG: helix-turn-helix transcriptional regulator [Sandaracinaceae bacterium]|nr:helix-turn-helix transcriptional regulator [Sandaracinaceae bacterium]
MRILGPEERRAERVRLFEELGSSGLGLGETVRRLRRITGLTQKDFAARIAGISTPALAQIERGEANPTLETLQKIGKAFGLDVGFVRKPPAPG